MKGFSREINGFLTQVGANDKLRVGIVPKSDSCGGPGDIVFFRYQLGVGKGSRAFRILLITQPVTKDAKTGNLLLTGFKVPPDDSYSPTSLQTLYNNRELPEEEYRTYIMSNIFGPLRKISRLPPDEVEQ